MKVIIVLFSVFLFVGCYENKEPSNACFFLDEAKKCGFKTKKREPCLLRAFGYMTVIGTRYEYLLARVAHGELTAYFEKEEEGGEKEEGGGEKKEEESGTIADISPLFDIISKADKQNLSFNFYENHNECCLNDKADPPTDILIKFRRHYNCPAPKI